MLIGYVSIMSRPLCSSLNIFQTKYWLPQNILLAVCNYSLMQPSQTITWFWTDASNVANILNSGGERVYFCYRIMEDHVLQEPIRNCNQALSSYISQLIQRICLLPIIPFSGHCTPADIHQCRTDKKNFKQFVDSPNLSFSDGINLLSNRRQDFVDAYFDSLVGSNSDALMVVVQNGRLFCSSLII